ncbi:MAG: NUDIX hydrolase [Candidatus Omnitrophota bacterium]
MKENAEVLAEGRFVRFIKKNGWEYIQRTNCTGIVVIVPVTDDGKVLLVRQYRAPVNGDVLEFPAGLVNDEAACGLESEKQAAERELLEETGYRAQEIVPVFSGPGGAGVSADILTFFIARGLVRENEGGGDETEKIAVHAVALAEVDQWLRERAQEGVMADPKIYAGLYWLNSYNNKSASRTE